MTITMKGKAEEPKRQGDTITIGIKEHLGVFKPKGVVIISFHGQATRDLYSLLGADKVEKQKYGSGDPFLQSKLKDCDIEITIHEK